MRNKKVLFGLIVFCFFIAALSVREILITSGYWDKMKISILTKQTKLGDKLVDTQVTLTWDNVPGAKSYNLYWSETQGVTKKNGKKISYVSNPYTFAGLKRGKTYYFVVTAVNSSAESHESEEVSFTVSE
jgi:fibronectin type 3 domain-containing protein